MLNKSYINICFRSKHYVKLSSKFCSQVPSTYKHLDKIKTYIEVAQQTYEDVMGMTTIKKIQGDVIEVEKALNRAQLERQDIQNELDKIRSKIKNITMEMEKTPRSHDSYLKLVTEEHSLLKLEGPLQYKFERAVESERVTFEELSKRVRHAHEKERERVEKTRVVSLLCTIFGTGVGIMGSLISDIIKNKRLQKMYDEAKELGPKINGMHDKLNNLSLDRNLKIDVSKELKDQIKVLNISTNELFKMINNIQNEFKNEEKKVESIIKIQNVITNELHEKIDKIQEKVVGSNIKLIEILDKLDISPVEEYPKHPEYKGKTSLLGLIIDHPYITLGIVGLLLLMISR
uniref:Coiled-coil domain-containing protein 51 n=1 Tax=Parastrongyloides trichosuri TaxID=131310 RepID=A0A0N4ZU97_PARTI